MTLELMDEDTIFLLSPLISKKNGTKDAGRVFQKAKVVAKLKPEIVSDGFPLTLKPFRRKPRVKHISICLFHRSVE